VRRRSCWQATEAISSVSPSARSGDPMTKTRGDGSRRSGGRGFSARCAAAEAIARDLRPSPRRPDQRSRRDHGAAGEHLPLAPTNFAPKKPTPIREMASAFAWSEGGRSRAGRSPPDENDLAPERSGCVARRGEGARSARPPSRPAGPPAIDRHPGGAPARRLPGGALNVENGVGDRQPPRLFI
jgi:hypothetical protein